MEALPRAALPAELHTLSGVADKFLIELVNNLDVSQDHIRVQRARSGVASRFYDGLTGQGQRRQSAVNEALTGSLEAVVTCIGTLVESQTLSNRAITRASEEIVKLQQAATRITHFSADTRERLDGLAQALDARCQRIEQEVRRVDFEQCAERQLEQLFNQWGAGQFDALSWAGRWYATVEALRWGDFGEYCRAHPGKVREGFLRDLVNRAIRQLREDAGSEDRLPAAVWLSRPANVRTGLGMGEAVAYLGNWSAPFEHPFVFTISQSPATEAYPLTLPRLFSAERLSTALVTEVMGAPR